MVIAVFTQGIAVLKERTATLEHKARVPAHSPIPKPATTRTQASAVLQVSKDAVADVYEPVLGGKEQAIAHGPGQEKVYTVPQTGDSVVGRIDYARQIRYAQRDEQQALNEPDASGYVSRMATDPFYI